MVLWLGYVNECLAKLNDARLAARDIADERNVMRNWHKHRTSTHTRIYTYTTTPFTCTHLITQHKYAHITHSRMHMYTHALKYMKLSQTQIRACTCMHSYTHMKLSNLLVERLHLVFAVWGSIEHALDEEKGRL